MLANGHQRNEARRALLDLEVLSAIVSSLSKGAPPVTKLHQVLKEQVTS
jgi:hypothetical protein